jgi:hypothetical protein
MITIPVHVAPVAHTHDHDEKVPVLNRVDDAVIAHPDAPAAGRALDRLGAPRAQAGGTLARCWAGVHPPHGHADAAQHLTHAPPRATVLLEGTDPWNDPNF